MKKEVKFTVILVIITILTSLYYIKTTNKDIDVGNSNESIPYTTFNPKESNYSKPIILELGSNT